MGRSGQIGGEKKWVGQGLRYLSSLSFLMLSEFSEIGNAIFLPANSLWSGPPQETSLSGHFPLSILKCASGLRAPMRCGFCCYCHFISFQPVSQHPYTDAWVSFSVIIH